MLSDREIIDATVVDRVGCPVCHQRGEQAIDCHCCGGIGSVDCDHIQAIVRETLCDVMSNYRGATQVPPWLHPGYYALTEGDGSPVFYIVREDRTAHCVDADRLNNAWKTTQPQTSMLVRVLVRVLIWVGRKLPRLRGAA